jgi:hypothetical protein
VEACFADLYMAPSNCCISTRIENCTHVNMNLFTQNSPCYHLLKQLLFLLKHPVNQNKKYFKFSEHCGIYTGLYFSIHF